MKRKRIVRIWEPARIYPIKFSDHPNLVPVKMVGGGIHMKRLIHGRWYVPIAFIPREGKTICSRCKKMRQLMTIHCEHCDAPLMGFEGVERTPADNIAKHGALCFCEDCRETQSKQERQTEMDFTGRKANNNRPSGNSGGRTFERRPFLKAANLPSAPNGKDGRPVVAKVEGFRDAPEQMQFSQFLVDLRIGKEAYVLGIKDETDRKLDALISVLGPKTDRWPGKSFKLYAGWWQGGKQHTIQIVRAK